MQKKLVSNSRPWNPDTSYSEEMHVLELTEMRLRQIVY